MGYVAIGLGILDKRASGDGGRTEIIGGSSDGGLLTEFEMAVLDRECRSVATKEQRAGGIAIVMGEGSVTHIHACWGVAAQTHIVEGDVFHLGHRR